MKQIFTLAAGLLLSCTLPAQKDNQQGFMTDAQRNVRTNDEQGIYQDARQNIPGDEMYGDSKDSRRLILQKAQLSISVVNNRADYKIELDGRRYNMEADGSMVQYLDEGKHNIKIYQDTKRTGGGLWNFFGKKQDVIYNSSVYLKRGFQFQITINRYGRAVVNESRMDYGYDNGGWGNGGQGNGVMSNREFETAKKLLLNEPFENKRVNLARFIIDRNNFTMQQVRELLSTFAFESNKLEIAKYAYGKTIDRKNYYLLGNEFVFSSNREALLKYIRNH